MKAIEMTTVSHPQSGREVKGIFILGKSFVYSDSRGYGTNAHIDAEVADEIISKFECAKGRTGINVYYPERLKSADIKLSWWNYGGGDFELRIHSHGQHVWTSKIINTNN